MFQGSSHNGMACFRYVHGDLVGNPAVDLHVENVSCLRHPPDPFRVDDPSLGVPVVLAGDRGELVPLLDEKLVDGCSRWAARGSCAGLVAEDLPVAEVRPQAVMLDDPHTAVVDSALICVSREVNQSLA